MKEELKPCPFCGWKMEWGDGNEPEPWAYVDGVGIYTIACPDCGCGVAPSETLEGVIFNWNRRTKIEE
jgi:endogenous inhibitor of DNA gyrase (YacG/DUF329 family)